MCYVWVFHGLNCHWVAWQPKPDRKNLFSLQHIRVRSTSRVRNRSEVTGGCLDKKPKSKQRWLIQKQKAEDRNCMIFQSYKHWDHLSIRSKPRKPIMTRQKSSTGKQTSPPWQQICSETLETPTWCGSESDGPPNMETESQNRKRKRRERACAWVWKHAKTLDLL